MTPSIITALSHIAPVIGRMQPAARTAVGRILRVLRDAGSLIELDAMEQALLQVAIEVLRIMDGKSSSKAQVDANVAQLVQHMDNADWQLLKRMVNDLADPPEIEESVRKAIHALC